MTSPRIDLWADLNAEDDEGRNWSMVDRAREPAALLPGVVLIAGVEGLWSVVRIDAESDTCLLASHRSHRGHRRWFVRRSRAL